jgi:hypothetical protein
MKKRPRGGAGGRVVPRKTRPAREAPPAPTKAGAGVSIAPSSSAQLTRAIEQRLRDRSREFDRAKQRFERLSHSIRGGVRASGETAGVPRLLQPGPMKVRELQRQMQDLAIEMRLQTARRAELLWMQELLKGLAVAT